MRVHLASSEHDYWHITVPTVVTGGWVKKEYTCEEEGTNKPTIVRVYSLKFPELKILKPDLVGWLPATTYYATSKSTASTKTQKQKSSSTNRLPPDSGDGPEWLIGSPVKMVGAGDYDGKYGRIAGKDLDGGYDVTLIIGVERIPTRASKERLQPVQWRCIDCSDSSNPHDEPNCQNCGRRWPFAGSNRAISLRGAMKKRSSLRDETKLKRDETKLKRPAPDTFCIRKTLAEMKRQPPDVAAVPEKSEETNPKGR